MRIFQVDAFTATRFAGNPATVVLDADGQSDGLLAAVAREFSHAETAFVLPAGGSDHDVRLRFFSARKESPFVGHATIAAHTVLLALGRRSAGRCRQHSGTGILDVHAEIEQGAGGSQTLIEFRQTAPQLGAPLPFKSALRIAEGLKLPATLLHDIMPARIAVKGSSRLLLPVADAQALESLAPNFATLQSLGHEFGADGFFVFAVNRDADELATESRMFCPALGIPEDPVSGNAHAMLAAYLWDIGQFSKKSRTFIGRQGSQMHRPGQVRVRLEIDRGALLAAHIAGTAVIVSEGTLAM